MKRAGPSGFRRTRFRMWEDRAVAWVMISASPWGSQGFTAAYNLCIIPPLQDDRCG